MTLGFVSSSPAWTALGSAVLQFLWQGALIGLLAFFVLRVLQRRSSGARYVVASLAMFACLLCFVGTFLVALAGSSQAVHVMLPSALGVEALATDLSSPRGADGIAAWCWAVGVLFMTCRFALHGFLAHRLKTTAVTLPGRDWSQAFDRLKHELGVTRAVGLLRSGLAEVPMVVGWFSPVVLVPASAFTSLSPDELRALLAHELAHVRRHDHLLNAAQVVVETVLFFHPVVWWISKQLRIEREYCCDDSSVRVTGNPRLLAEALAAMEGLRIQHPPTDSVLAANGGLLMQRIARILGARLDGRTSLSGWQLPAGLALSGILALASTAYADGMPDVDGAGVERQDDKHHDEKVHDHERHDKEHARHDKDQARHDEKDHDKKRRLPEATAEQVWARLNKGVEAGRITEAQAKERFEAWKKDQAERKDRQAMEEDKMRAELEAAVKAGKITEAQAKERLAAWKSHRADEEALHRVELEAAIHEIQAAVKAGKMTQEEGRKKIEELKQRLHRKAVHTAGLEDQIKKIRAAIDAGHLTPEEGHARIVALKKELAERAAAIEREYKEAEAKIRAAVEAGELTPEEGRARLEEYRKRLKEKRLPQKEDPEAVMRKIEAAVEAGKLTPEEGRARIEAYKKELAERKAREDRMREHEIAARSIQEAMRAGEMTEAEAKAKLEELRRRLVESEKKSSKKL